MINAYLIMPVNCCNICDINIPSLILITCLFTFLSEPELEKNMSTIGELSKRLLSRWPNVEPILSQQFLQRGINILVEISESRSASVVDQDHDEDSGSKGMTNSSADHKAKSMALEADSENSQGTENKGEGEQVQEKED
jgi:hypothetical protein